ncbi:MAG: alpha/beta fold hydrolase [Rhodospirillales bacterium]
MTAESAASGSAPARLPEALSEDAFTMADGAVIHARRHGRAAGPRVFVSHGNGFAADGFRHLWAPLLDGCETVVFDQRGHGRNTPGALADHTWARMAEDTAAVVTAVNARYGEKPAAGLFHSMSGVHALRAEVKSPGLFTAGIVGLEPPVPPPAGHPLLAATGADRQAVIAAARIRKDRFNSVDEMVKRYRAKDAFALARTDCIRALAESILRPVPDADGGGWTLICPIGHERQIYETHRDDGLFAALFGVKVPVLMITAGGAAAGANVRGLEARAAAEAGGFKCLEMERTTHLMPLERPEDIAAEALRFLKL